MERSALVLLALVAATSAAASEVQVRVSGDRVDIVAAAAPLADILRRLSQQIGMAVVYDGPQPRQILTATLLARTPVEAVIGLLEGTGLNYALRMDPTGRRVDTLWMIGAVVASSAAQAAPVPIQPSDPPGPLESSADEPQQDEKREPPTPSPTPPPSAGPASFTGPAPGPGQPGSPFTPGLGPLTIPTPLPAQPAASAPPAPGRPAPVPSPTPPGS